MLEHLSFNVLCLKLNVDCWGSYLVMGQPSSRKNGDLLSSGNAVHAINGWDTSLDHLFRVDTALGVDGLAWWSKQPEGHRGRSTPREAQEVRGQDKKQAESWFQDASGLGLACPLRKRHFWVCTNNEVSQRSEKKVETAVKVCFVQLDRMKPGRTGFNSAP